MALPFCKKTNKSSYFSKLVGGLLHIKNLVIQTDCYVYRVLLVELSSIMSLPKICDSLFSSYAQNKISENLELLSKARKRLVQSGCHSTHIPSTPRQSQFKKPHQNPNVQSWDPAPCMHWLTLICLYPHMLAASVSHTILLRKIICSPQLGAAGTADEWLAALTTHRSVPLHLVRRLLVKPFRV